MSDLLIKAKQLMNETGCSLPEAAQALREANEDYDLAMALINDKKGAAPAPSVNKPASAPQVQQAPQPTYNNQPYQPRAVNPANVEFKVPLVGNYITIALGVFLLLGGIVLFFLMNAMAADYDTTILEVLSGHGPLYGSDIIFSILPTMIALILFGIMSIIFPIVAIKNYKRSIDTLKEIKAQFPDVLDPIIFAVYRISKKDKEKTIAMLRSKSGVLNAKFNNFNNKDVGNIVGVFFLLILAVAGWCIAAFTYDPEVNQNFEVPQIVGVIVAFIFLIAGVVFMIKTVKNAKSQAAKGYTLFFWSCYDRYWCCSSCC
ncbi:MAG: hypothetical protein MJZ37_03150 [Bacilli bacterium]|nr:hypothetical protein [Bacilli bacterium]